MTSNDKRDGGRQMRPPRLAAWLLRRVLPRDARAASIAGDLVEEFHADLARRSRIVAAARYWRHALSIAARYAFRPRPVGRAPALDALHASASGRPSVLGALREDLRDARRSLIKHPGFSAVAVLTLAVGVGANTAIFSVLHAVVLRDLPYRDADRLALLWTLNLRQNLRDGSSYLNFRDWKAQSRSFDDMAIYRDSLIEFTPAPIPDTSQPERIHTALVGPGFFRLLGTPALIGRTLERSDFETDHRSVVISYGLWRQQFGADPGVTGRALDYNGTGYEVVGVMPSDFELPTSDVQLWAPITVQPGLWEGLQHDPRSRGGDLVMVLGRLAPRATYESARAELDAIAARLRDVYPDTNAGHGVLIEPLTDHVIGSRTGRALWLLFGAVGFVVLIACANVANLALARGVARRRELSIRTALGASKRRLVRQALTENLVLAVLAAGAGVLLAWLAAAALRAWAASALPRLETVGLDVNVLLFALLLSVICGLVAGLLPALRSSGANPVEALWEGGARSLGGAGSRRLRHGLVIAELALAVVLLSGAGLLIHSFVRLYALDRGFDSRHVLLLQVDLAERYDGQARKAEYYRTAFERIRALPGVVAAGAIGDLFIERTSDLQVTLEGRPKRGPDDPTPPLIRDRVVPGYFEAMRIPLRQGRYLRDADLVEDLDNDHPRAVVINEAMARAFWPGQDAVGKRVKVGRDPRSDAPWITVVGVVADAKRDKLDEATTPSMFWPGFGPQMDIVVRTAGDPEAVQDAVRAELRALEPTAPPYGIVAVEQRLWETVALRTLQTMLLGALAAAALILAVIGVYGVIHQSVVARTQEIGVRMALGASKASVLRMILSGALGLSVTGLTVGMMGALALSQALSSFLYQTSPLDPLIYIAVALLLVFVTMAACLAPAYRAARVDPMTALRYE